MSKLYPDKKPVKEKVRCMDCDDFDIQDMYCIPKKKDVQDPYVLLRCSRFVRIKEKSRVELKTINGATKNNI